MGRSFSRGPDWATTNAVIKNNWLIGKVLLPAPASIGSGSAPLLYCGCGIPANPDANRYVANHVDKNAVVGIGLLGDATAPPHLTARGNITVGNSGLVAGSASVLANNSISGSQTSVTNVGQAIPQSVQQGTKPAF